VASFLEPSEDKTLIGRLDQYDVLEVIGCGGMGLVLKGRDRPLNRPVAIKVLGPQYATNAAARRRFVREAQAAAAVVHPHVVAIHGVNANSRLPYLVMPYVAGPSLQQRIDELGPLDLRDVLRISFQAAQGLAAAHAQGLVHRDIKPANILLENGVQRVLLTDFGLARAIDDISVTHSGTIAGTPQFMSPEQARGEPLDHRTDLFSLGSVMYTMCAGRPPFRAESTMGVLRRICDETPRDLQEINADVPPWLAGIIGKLLAKTRDARFQSADELARLLERCLAHLQHPTAVALPEEVVALVSQQRRSRAQSRRTAVLAASLVAVGALTAWLGWWVVTRDRTGTGDNATASGAIDAVPASPAVGGMGALSTPNIGVAGDERSELPAAKSWGRAKTRPQPPNPEIKPGRGTRGGSSDRPGVEFLPWRDGMEQELTDLESAMRAMESDESSEW
jgi:serine/threonine-protein kinase